MERVRRNEGINKKVAFVFSCPGSAEEKSQRLVSGPTGKNLNKVINILRDEFLQVSYFDSEDRYDYRITNASDKIHYKAKDGRSEPTKKEIMEEENTSRLINDLEGFKVIITFGRNATLAVNHCKGALGNPGIISVRHLGLQSLNQIKQDVEGKPIQNLDKKSGSENTVKRLRVIAKEIVSSLNEE